MTLPDWSDSDLAAIASLLDDAAGQYGVPRDILYAVAGQESRYVPTASNPADPSYGIMGLMLPTAEQMGYTGDVTGLYDPAINIPLGAAYLSYQFEYYGDWNSAISAYNAGRGGEGNNPAYVTAVLARVAYFDAAWQGSATAGLSWLAGLVVAGLFVGTLFTDHAL